MMNPQRIYGAVAKLAIEHPDPDRYDDVWNTAIKAACDAIIEAVKQERQPSQLVPPVWRQY